MKKILQKKDSGVLDQILPVFVGIIMLTIIFVLMLGTMESIQTKNKVDLVARRAILLLETYGYIDSTMRGELEQQLAEGNVTNVAITTRGYSKNTREWGIVSESNPASYGQKVEVIITGTTDALFGTVEGENIFSTLFERSSSQVRVVRVSTSKN